MVSHSRQGTQPLARRRNRAATDRQFSLISSTGSVISLAAAFSLICDSLRAPGIVTLTAGCVTQKAMAASPRLFTGPCTRKRKPFRLRQFFREGFTLVAARSDILSLESLLIGHSHFSGKHSATERHTRNIPDMGFFCKGRFFRLVLASKDYIPPGSCRIDPTLTAAMPSSIWPGLFK